MTQRILLATFRNEQDLRSAVRTIRSQGANILDVYSPYPVHGLEEDLGWRPSRLTWACGICGAIGALFITWYQFWTSSVDWPVNVGGKPYNSLPAYVPVIFEAMVLCGAFGVVFAFLVVARLRPGKQPFLIRPQITDDRFALLVEQGDATFDPQEMTGLLEAHHAEQIEETVLDDRRANDAAGPGGRTALLWVNYGLLGMLLLIVLAVLVVPRNLDRPNLEFIPTMRRSIPIESQTALAGLPVARPIPGTIARDAQPLHYQATEEDAKRAGDELQNPFSEDDVAVLDRGRDVFINFCISCHGPEGLGDGPIALRGYPPPPPLGTEKSQLLKDGELFHAISYGRNFMPPHHKLLSQDDRWKVLIHVRGIQREALEQMKEEGEAKPDDQDSTDSLVPIKEDRPDPKPEDETNRDSSDAAS